MKAADLATANSIATRLAKIKAIRTGTREIRPVQFLISWTGGASEWVSLSKAAGDRAYRTMLCELDAEEAQLRRRAAQIGLSL